MLAGIRDVTPRRRLGSTIALFGASGPIGFAVGPALAGLLIDGLGWSLPAVFWLSAALSVGTALLVGLGSREVRPQVVPQGRVLDLAFGAVRGVLEDATVRRIFVIFGVAFVATQMSRSYLPVLVEGLAGTGPGLASAIALVMGTAALVGAVVSSFGGVLGDRIGFRPVLIAALIGGGTVLVLMPFVSSVAALAGLAVVLGTATSTVSAMVFGLLATEVPSERRSATLNLVYLPLYGAGVVGPAIGAGVASVAGVDDPFFAGGAVFLLGALVIGIRRRAAEGSATVTAADVDPVTATVDLADRYPPDA
jgi:DHA1 family multidrug resistance protein-like MFS transporter